MRRTLCELMNQSQSYKLVCKQILTSDVFGKDRQSMSFGEWITQLTSPFPFPQYNESSERMRMPLNIFVQSYWMLSERPDQTPLRMKYRYCEFLGVECQLASVRNLCIFLLFDLITKSVPQNDQARTLYLQNSYHYRTAVETKLQCTVTDSQACFPTKTTLFVYETKARKAQLLKWTAALSK